MTTKRLASTSWRALQAPARQIAENAGEDGAVIAGKILDSGDYAVGYNAAENRFDGCGETIDVETVKTGLSPGVGDGGVDRLKSIENSATSPFATDKRQENNQSYLGFRRLLRLTLRRPMGLPTGMMGKGYWLSRLMVVVMILASGSYGLAAYAAHDDHMTLGHVTGAQAQHDHHHDHHHSGNIRLGTLQCDLGGACDQPADQKGHVHLTFSMYLAIAPSDAGLNLADHSEAMALPLGASPLLDSPSYPLLRPPRART
jgi:hypothetical protein